MATSTQPIAVTMGDPAGCGPQITCDAWLRRDELKLPSFFVVGDPRLYESQVPVKAITALAEAVTLFHDALPVLPIELSGFDSLTVGEASVTFAESIIESIEAATGFCLSGTAAAMVTNPISKAVLYEAGFKFPGHTEFIASLAEVTTDTPIRPIMMLVGGGLRVALTTIHVPLMSVMHHLTTEALSATAIITNEALIKDFGIAKPRIAFTGLNPHAGEGGTIGTEERDLINPAAKALRQRGIDISDARPADTVFHEALTGAYDAVIAMTHDQGLIPVKTLDLWGGVNTTLGLTLIRTSPDHGTAYDAAAAGTCRSDSLIAALRLAREMADNRLASNE